MTQTPASSPYISVFRNRRVGVILLLGFSSGLPLALTGGTLQAWLTVSNVDLSTIGWFSWIGLPYTLKFLWSPLMDRYVPPLLGRRRGWMVATQLARFVCLVGMGSSAPAQALPFLALFALGAAFASASQDIVVDAYRTDLLTAPERGSGAAVAVLGYRIAMLVSGGLALIVADRYLGWGNTYYLMALLLSVGMVTALLAPEPAAAGAPPKSLREAVAAPLAEMLSRPGALYFLLIILLYKFGDALAFALLNTFFIRELGFTPTDVGIINKWLGFAATILGALTGGALMARLSLFRALLLFGAIQAFSNLSFMFLAWAGKSYAWLIFAVALENFASGMGTAAFVALAMALCDHRFSATQYALLSALGSLGRIVAGPINSHLVAWIGWADYYLVAFLASLPALWLIWRLRRELEKLSPAPA